MPNLHRITLEFEKLRDQLTKKNGLTLLRKRKKKDVAGNDMGKQCEDYQPEDNKNKRKTRRVNVVNLARKIKFPKHDH